MNELKRMEGRIRRKGCLTPCAVVVIAVWQSEEMVVGVMGADEL